MIDVDGRRIGDGWFGLIAGPCSVETRAQTLETARAVASGGRDMAARRRVQAAHVAVRVPGTGSRRSRSSRRRKHETGLPIVTELMDPRHVEAVLDAADVIQIGARNSQNFLLLAEVGRTDKPVLLKRGASTSVEELLMAAEYVAKEGNDRIILCERGIKTFETATRYTLDLGAVAGTEDGDAPAGDRRPLAPCRAPRPRAAARARGRRRGADGIIVETHPRPEEALSDAAQQIPSAEFGAFADEIRAFVALMGKQIG